MSIELHFTEDDWARVERDWNAWWAGELKRPVVVIPTFDTFFHRSRREFTTQFLLEKPVEEVLDYYQERLQSAYFYGDAWPKWSPYFGPGIMTGFLGGKVEPLPEQRTVWFEADNPVPYDKLHFVYDPENTWWRRVKDLTSGAVERWGDEVNIAHTDIGGVLDVLASFRKTYTLLKDLYDCPEEVVRCTRELTSLWMRYYDGFSEITASTGRGTSCWAPLWSTRKTYMHQCDFSYMISPAMFERFVIADLDHCFKQMEHAFYHLDGKGQVPHLKMLLSLKSLKGIQWIPGAGQPPPSQWLPLLRQIRDAGKLCQLFVSAEESMTIAREIGGKGFAFCVLDPMKPEEVSAFLKALLKESNHRNL
ncbi:MAG: hypothetical protein Q8O43_03240 [Dehalococcoidia bacterium]|nr:hypothetical protein [Dehalococcoidia bacterium]